jgi:predicted SprT family Zn-dependent metalloprotease
MRLNPSYFEAVGDAYRQTVAHEFAHLVAFALGVYRKGERPHGRTWSALMVAFGFTPERSSSYDYDAVRTIAKARRTFRYVYQGVNCGHEYRVSGRMHKRLQSGASTAFCRKCLSVKPRHECGVAFTGTRVER